MASIPTDLIDAGQMALDEALAEAGYARLFDQVLACDKLEDDLLDALWNNDMTLQEAALSAVRAHEGRLMKENESACVA